MPCAGVPGAWEQGVRHRPSAETDAHLIFRDVIVGTAGMEVPWEVLRRHVCACGAVEGAPRSKSHYASRATGASRGCVGGCRPLGCMVSVPEVLWRMAPARGRCRGLQDGGGSNRCWVLGRRSTSR